MGFIERYQLKTKPMKAKEKFEDFLEITKGEHMIGYPDDWQLNVNIIEVFNQLPDSMKWGVYLEFFDSEGIEIEIFKNKRKSDDFRVYINQIHYPLLSRLERQQAQTEAINKAFEILEERL